MVIILAAGRGSRMRLPEGISKCSITIGNDAICSVCSVSRLILQMIKYSEEREFVIITGYGHEALEKSVTDIAYSDDVDLKFVYNPRWDSHGTAASLALGLSQVKDSTSEIYIFEGDSVLSDTNISQMVRHATTCCLTRSDDYLSPQSVAVLSINAVGALSFIYDTSHRVSVQSLQDTNIYVYDSMQAWKIHGVDHVACIRRSCSSSPKFYETNLEPLNHFIATYHKDMDIVRSQDPDGWVNLNTSEDVAKAQALIKKDIVQEV